jgi:pyruvate-formate lyase-activating enzyme
MKKVHPKIENYLLALVANPAGDIFELPGYAAVGCTGADVTALTHAETIALPHGSELMFLPDRYPIVINLRTGEPETLTVNPFAPHEPLFPVAAFNSPGYIISATCAYSEADNADWLPLFSYGAVGWHENHFRSAAIEVDSEPRQDLRHMPQDKIALGIRQKRTRLPQNRLRRHLEKCALTYGCPAAKNFFLGRYEAPLPTSPRCNARCRGCLSHQSDTTIPHSQDRIDFEPSAAEIAAVALTHINGVKNAVVSFGQGCEGDPLMASRVIVPAVRKIRKTTAKGTINMNTNGSLPDAMRAVIDAGIDSARFSINSFQPACYQAYFRPRSYRWQDVTKSISLCLQRGIHVAINYLNLPGFTDSEIEFLALKRFLDRHPVHMIQWRNLNFDPQRYLALMDRTGPKRKSLGIRPLLGEIRRAFPDLRYGYFNPPKEIFGKIRPHRC